MRRRCDGMRRSSSHCNPILFSRMTPPPLRRCCNKREAFPLFSRLLPIRSAAASWQASRGREATLPVLRCTKPRSTASGWSYSRRQYRAFPGLSSFSTRHRAEITSLAARYRLPAVYPFRFFAELGGLISYGVNLNDNFRRAVPYVDRILRGAKPSELPVQAPVKFELVINLKTAKALGLTVPDTLLARADEV